MGVQYIKRKVMAPSYGASGTGSEMDCVEVTLTSAQVKALRATPITIVPAPGAGKVAVPIGGIAALDYAGTNVFAEAVANLALKYTDGSGVQISQTIETTGFIDQAVDTMTTIESKLDGIVAKAGCDNKAIVLHNLGAGEITGNAGNDNILRIRLWYAVHTLGWT